MPYLIDGHNLIPKINGLSLRSIDDEMQLVELLQEFCRIRRKQQVEVFFDKAAPGGVPARRFGPVTARFVRHGMTADAAISNKLKRLGRSARNWSVVSSDRQVQAAARAAQAQVISSEDFASQLDDNLQDAESPDAGEKVDTALSEDELDEWMHLFGAEE